MKLLCLSDLHDQLAALERILAEIESPDMVLVAGDLTTFGQPDDAEPLVRRLQAIGCPVWAVSGNCDSAAIDRRLAELGVGVHARAVVERGVAVQGLSGIPPWHRNMYQFTEAQLADALAAGRAQMADARRHVVLSHCPPRDGRLDRTMLLQHVGSLALRQYIERVEPDLVVCGHIHEGRGVETMGRTTVVNCGPAAEGYYAIVELGPPVDVALRGA